MWTAVVRRAHGTWTRRALTAAVVAVLVANAVVLSAAAYDDGPDGAAAAAVALASTGEIDADVAPLEGIVVDVQTAERIDPSTPLPQPEPAPVDPYAPTPEVRLGTLEIPKIGVSQTLFEGVTLTAINRGPSHWPGTAMPGEVGNTVIAGHRTTYTKPFWALNELTPGDELIFTVDGERIVYRLDRLDVVHPTDVYIVDQRVGRTATLFACHPRGSARQRIVAHFSIENTVPVEFFDTLGGGRPLGDL
jgi:LPXTG-site transpeptidase (sortase) family protein